MVFSRFRDPAVILFLALFTSQSGFLVLTPILPDMARDLGVSIGTAGGLRVASGLAGGAAGLALAAGWRPLGLRNLIVAGLLLIAVGSLTAAIAPTFEVIAAAQLAIGAGNAVLLAGGVAAAARWSVAGDRQRVLSWALLGPPASWVVGMPLVGVLASSSWRLAMAFPLAAGAVALAAVMGRPADTPDRAHGGIWTLLARRRTVAGWAAGELLSHAAWSGTLTFAGALLLESYGLSTGLTAALLAASAVAYFPGTLLARRPVAQAPRGMLVLLGSGMAMLVAAFGAVRPGLGFSVALFALTLLLGGARTYAGSVVGLDAGTGNEVTVMSIRGAAVQFGIVAGALLGGPALTAGGYTLLGAVLSALFIAGAAPHLWALRGPLVTALGRLTAMRGWSRVRRDPTPTSAFAVAGYTSSAGSRRGSRRRSARALPLPLRRALPDHRLLLEAERPGMAKAGPGREQEQEARVAAGVDAVALGRLELDQRPDAAGRALGGVQRGHLDLAGDDDQPGAFVDLVVVEALARR